MPRMIPKLVRKHDEIHKTAGRQYHLDPMPVQDRLGAAGGHCTTRARGSMENMDVVWPGRRRPTRFGTWLADAAEWDPAAQDWRLVNGRTRRPGWPAGRADLARGAHPPPTPGVSPDDIALYHDRGSGQVELLSTQPASTS